MNQAHRGLRSSRLRAVFVSMSIFFGSSMEAHMEVNIWASRLFDAALSFDVAIERLRVCLNGGVLLPGADGYETARRVWNGIVDKRPAAILSCINRDDV